MASKVTDLNNLKQIMVTLHLYTADNNDVLPPPNWDNGGSMVQTGMAPSPAALQTGPDGHRHEPLQCENRIIRDTLRNPELYFCPMDKPESSKFGSRPQQISTYAMNGAVIGLWP